MRILGYVVLIVVSFVIEAKVSLFGIRPNASVLLVYYFGLRNGPLKGLAFGILVGAAADSLSDGILGPGILGKGMAGYLSSFIANSFFRWTPLVGFFAVGGLTALDRASSLFSLSIFEHIRPEGLYALYSIAVQSALNSLAGPFFKPRHED